jgi:hypothetical protein
MKKIKIISISVAILVLSSTLSTNAQTKRRKSSQRKTVVREQVLPRQQPHIVPPINNPKVLEPEVVSTAEETMSEDSATENSVDPANSVESKAQPTDQTPASSNELSQQIDKLNNKLNSLEGEQRSLINLEKLTRAEERAELLRKQLESAIEKETALTLRLEQLDYQSRPEIIEREMAGVGSTRPEQVRETRHKMLENEKLRAKQQLVQIKESRTRLETATVNAESLVERLNAIVENETKTKKSGDNVNQNNTTKNSSSNVATESGGSQPQ